MDEHPRGSTASIISGANSRSTTGATFQTAAAMERPKRPRPTEAAPSGFHVLTVPPAGAQASPAFPGPALSISYRFQAGAAARCRRTGSGLTGRHHSRALILLSLAFTSLPLAGNASSERCPCRGPPELQHAAQRREPEGQRPASATPTAAGAASRKGFRQRPAIDRLWCRMCVCVCFLGGAPRRVGRTRSGRVPRRRSCGERKRQGSTARCVRALVASK